MYQLTKHPTTVIRLSDGAFVPTNDPANVDCAEYLAWLEQGNVPLPAEQWFTF